jgi:hypothetical protein
LGGVAEVKLGGAIGWLTVEKSAQIVQHVRGGVEW